MSKDWTVFRYINVRNPKTGEAARVRVDLTFDLDAIALALGRKAWANSSKRSKLAIGIKAEASG